MSFDTHCLFSTIQNTSGERMICGLLPPHGRELEANEEFSCFGDIRDVIANRNGDRVTSARHIESFVGLVSAGDLAIKKTPAPIFQDTETDAVKMAKVTNGVLGVADPCWANSGSAVDDITGGNPYDG